MVRLGTEELDRLVQSTRGSGEAEEANVLRRGGEREDERRWSSFYRY